MAASTTDDLLYAVLLHRVEGRQATAANIHAHVAHLRWLDEAGALVLCGPFRDAPSGLVVLRAASRAEAEALAARDPFVGAGVRTLEVRILEVAHAGNGYLDAPEPPAPAG